MLRKTTVQADSCQSDLISKGWPFSLSSGNPCGRAFAMDPLRGVPVVHKHRAGLLT
jgi:hypothetical protein